ncbi:MAG: DUF4342 domain-containing protein [Eubacteriales bacterium]
MSINLEQIEMLKERAHIGYGEAKEVLEKCNYSVVDSLIYLETQSKLKTPKKEDYESGCCTTSKKIINTCQKLIKKGNETKFVIKKAENTVIDLPLNIVIVTTVIMPPLTAVGIVAALVTGHKIRFIKPDGEGMEINKTFDKISSTVTSVSNQVVEAINKN